jgi:sulfate-transporting ATPase
MSEWSLTLRFCLLGLGSGALYALGALGIVAIHRGSKTLNFAHGGLAVWGGFLFAELRDRHGTPAPLAYGVVLLGGATFGAATYLVVIRPIRHSHPVTRMVATLGLLALLVGVAQHVFYGRPVTTASSLPVHLVHVLGQPIGEDRLILLAIALATTLLLGVWSATSRLPLTTRALAEHEIGAQALGASPHAHGVLNWGLGCALAALSGALLAPIVGVSISALSTLVVFALAAALIGRFDSYGLALAGGLIVGVTESLFTHAATKWLPIGYGTGWAEAAPVVVVLIVLLLRPDRTSNRLAAEKATAVATAPIRAWVVAVGVGSTAVLILMVSAEWLDAITVSLCFTMLTLSLVVLVGFANQISLAQMAMAGLGALAAAQLSLHLGLPFVIAPLVGAVTGAAAGLLVGLPALRIRGSNLAVATIGLSLAIQDVVFANSKYTGGFEGLQPRHVSVFGIDVSAARHPAGYALVCLAWVVVALIVVLVVRRSKLGRQLLVMRSNERAAASLGISVTRAKLSAFAISSALAGAAGVLYAFRESSVTFTTFGFVDSINLVIVSVIAGVGTVLGAVVAGLSAVSGVGYTVISKVHLPFLQNNYATIFGGLLILTLLLHPNGLVWRRVTRREQIDFERHPEEQSVAVALRADGITVQFGGVRALSGVSLVVNPGEVVGLVGPNGAGKTTMLDALGGFAATAEGSFTLDGHPMLGEPPHRSARAGLGRVFQGGELLDDLTVAENICIAAENLSFDGRRVPRSVHALFERFGLAGDLAARPGELTMAKRKLVALARTLAGNPRVLLLDEPGAGLSITDSRQLALELRQCAAEQGLGVLVVDHDMALVMLACDRIVVLHNGSVLADGSPAEVQANSEVRNAYLGDAVEAVAVAHLTQAVPVERGNT